MFSRQSGSKELNQQHFVDFGIQVIEEIGFVRTPHDAPPKAGLMPPFYLGGHRGRLAGEGRAGECAMALSRQILRRG